jgi:putative ABC transport system permease protein
MGTLWQDLRYGFRMLAKSPGFTFVAVLALALGIGANSAIFSVVNTVLLQPLPFEQPEQLVRVYTTVPRRNLTAGPVSYLTFADFRAQNAQFEYVTAFSDTSATLAGRDEPEQIDGIVASGDFFKVLGAQAALGRTFTTEEERPDAQVVVISDGLWKRRFGGDAQIVGQSVTLNGEAVTIIGIMPEGFTFPIDRERVDFWSPIDPTSEENRQRGSSYLNVVARLRDGATLQQAQAEADAVAARLATEYADTNAGRSFTLISMHEDLVGDLRPALLVLLGAVAFVLLIACANVANLMLARASSRHKEIAIRTAMGASRWRIVRQLVTESLLLSLAGGALGLLIALWGVDLLVASIPSDMPRVSEIGLDRRVLAFTAVISMLTGFLFGLVPALQVSKPDLNEGLKEGGRGSTEGARRNRVRGALVVLEVALSLVLLVGAGLLMRSFVELREVKAGFDPSGVLTASVSLPDSKYGEEATQAEFFRRVLENLSARPGVHAASAVLPLPLSGSAMMNGLSIEGRPPAAPGERLTTHTRITSPEYFRAMNIPVVKGRALDERDSKDAPKVVVVNETFARKYFPGEEAIGKRVEITVAEDMSGEIVGIVGDVKHRSLDAAPDPEAYVSYRQVPSGYMVLVLKGDGQSAAALTSTLREAVRQVDAGQALAEIRTMEQLVSNSVARRRFNMLLLGVFAGVALALAAIGIFGVMNYTVTQRTHELGIRIALGAQTKDVLRLVVGQGMTLIVIGVVVGLAASFALTRLMQSLLYSVSATDPLTFAGVALVLASVALLACYIPARRATRVDPMVALRYE